MHFIYEPIESLPRLAWCARLHKQEEAIHVYHGSWVETRPEGFIEGAWDGPFEAFAFDEAITLVGTGGRLTEEGIVFAAPSQKLDWLQSLRRGDELLVSNSFTFLLVMAGAEPDLRHPNYFFDLLGHYRTGLHIVEKPLRLAEGRHVHLHVYGNILVTPALTLQWQERPTGQPPATYTEYVDFIEGTLGRIFDNVQHPGRSRSYRPVATLSKGYDSPAIAALARRAGCREAVTFAKSMDQEGGYSDDSGASLAPYLDLDATEYERLDYLKQSGLHDAEFYFNPFARGDKAMLVMEQQLTGCLLLFGRFGDILWKTGPSKIASRLQTPNTILMTGCALEEFRLRVGFLYFPVPYAGALHSAAIHQITTSKEMKPWSVGGYYDRPIARRILEEAGVPREAFGQHKHGGFKEGRALSSNCEEDFLAFYKTYISSGNTGKPSPLRRRVIRLMKHLTFVSDWLNHSAFFRRLIDRLLGYRLHSLWKSKYLYIFHWGFFRTKDRYVWPSTDPGETPDEITHHPAST